MTDSRNVAEQLPLRDRARAAIRAEIADRAIAIFDANGFDATTVDDIAVAVGISQRTFFRYFATKEDVIFGELVPLGRSVRDALAARPDLETPWQALRSAFQEIVDLAGANRDRSLEVTRVASSTPGLRARNLEKHNTWAEMLVPMVQQRIGAQRDADAIAEALVFSALACLEVALNRWAADGGDRPLEQLLDVLFKSVPGLGG